MVTTFCRIYEFIEEKYRDNFGKLKTYILFNQENVKFILSIKKLITQSVNIKCLQSAKMVNQNNMKNIEMAFLDG